MILKRNTLQKGIILSTLCGMDSHPTAGELYEAIHAAYPTISRSTVYRVLGQMAADGQVLRVCLTGSDDRFDGNTCPHNHIRCPRCGAPAVRNMRGRACFIPDKVMATRGAFEDFWARAQGGRTVFLELGVGFNSPGLIRHPFQRMTQFWPRAHLIRVNRDYPSVPHKLGDPRLGLGGDLGENLRLVA